MSSILNRITVLLGIICLSTAVLAQEGKVKKFCNLSGPEKRWVFAHLFIAGKSLKISEYANKVSEGQKDSPDLDGYANGGQVDAFRHCFWMASLCAQIKEKKALKLGVAHEEGNEKDFKKRREEEGDLPDAIANTMDLWNNQIGADVNRENPNIEEEVLITLVKAAVTSGMCRIVKRNSNGDFLDLEGNIIERESWHGKWVNARCLVTSDKTAN